jgi:hypothetical protein
MRYMNGGIASSMVRRQFWGLPPLANIGAHRAVVLHVHWPSDESNTSKNCFEVDLALYNRHWLPNVPVMHYQGGGDSDIWVPQPSLRTFYGEEFYGAYKPTDPEALARFLSNIGPIDELDGDHVLVDYVEGRAYCPIVTGRITHRAVDPDLEREYRAPEVALHHGACTGFTRRWRHSDTKFGVDEAGNFFVDAHNGGWPNNDGERRPQGPRGRVYVQGTGVVLRNMQHDIAGLPVDTKGPAFCLEQKEVKLELPNGQELVVEQNGAPSTEKVARAGVTTAEFQKLHAQDQAWRAWATMLISKLPPPILDADKAELLASVPQPLTELGDLPTPGIRVP